KLAPQRGGTPIHACQFTRDALDSRDKENFTALIQREARLLVEEKIRESGDRGTSILNYLTNMCAFLAALVLLARERKIPDGAIKKMIAEFFADEGQWFDIIAEGDDGEQFFSKMFLALLGYKHGEKYDKATFAKDFFSCYKELGLRIEPQGPAGEVPFEKALVPTSGRMEFCSKLFIYLRGAGAWLPKPKKTFVGSQVSFDVSHDLHTAGMVKSLALMNNTYRKSEAGAGCGAAARKLQQSQAWNYYAEHNQNLISESIDDQYDALVKQHEAFRVEDISRCVDKAFCQETGMSVISQREWSLSFSRCDGGNAKRVLAAFLSAIGC
ncbi:unnamed protein product, partial [Symbiodinium sp. CCMP2456]